MRGSTLPFGLLAGYSTLQNEGKALPARAGGQSPFWHFRDVENECEYPANAGPNRFRQSLS
jgi:hypothetical protein